MSHLILNSSASQRNSTQLNSLSSYHMGAGHMIYPQNTPPPPPPLPPLPGYHNNPDTNHTVDGLFCNIDHNLFHTFTYLMT